MLDVINAKMAQAIRTLTVEQGIEPRDFALVAFGGAGPMHAAFLARELEIARGHRAAAPRRVLAPGGCCETRDPQGLQPRLLHAARRRRPRTTLAAVLARARGRRLRRLAEEGIARDTGRVEHALDIRYVGQEYTLTIPLTGAGEPRDDDFARRLADALPRGARARASATPTRGAPVELVVVRTTALGDLGRAEPAAPTPSAAPDAVPRDAARSSSTARRCDAPFVAPRRPRAGRGRRGPGGDRGARPRRRSCRRAPRSRRRDSARSSITRSGEDADGSRPSASTRSRPRSSAARSTRPRTR